MIARPVPFGKARDEFPTRGLPSVRNASRSAIRHPPSEYRVSPARRARNGSEWDTPALRRRVAAGGKDAFEAMWASANRSVRAIILSFRITVHEADDVLQTVALRALRNRRTLRPDGSCVGWITAVTRSTCLNFLHHKTATETDLTDALEQSLAAPPDTPDPFDATGAPIVGSHALRHALNTLSSRQRQVIELRYLHDCSVKEVAAQLGITEGTVKSTTHQAMLLLRQALDCPNQTAPPS